VPSFLMIISSHTCIFTLVDGTLLFETDPRALITFISDQLLAMLKRTLSAVRDKNTLVSVAFFMTFGKI